jgi:iron complex outermembrane recepter protein
VFNKIIFFFLVLLLAFCQARAQNCNITIRGYVLDEASGLPLPYATVILQETINGTKTGDNGYFALTDICAGSYHLLCSYMGSESLKIHLEVDKDTVLKISLQHTSIPLEAAVVNGKKSNFSNQPTVSVNRQDIEDNTNLNLSGLIENETGVHLIKNGSGISKPVVHGLYGNRLIILNNGIIQGGQQWGNDHSPEIDPFSADKITLLKGASAIEYGGGNLGSVILVEPRRIEREPHLHGQVTEAFETNGRGNTFNARLEKYSPIVAWRVNGTIKKYGDKKTATYFLRNTGLEEANLSVQLEKSWNDKLFLDFFASTFNTRLAILRGAHIGNLTDLEQALNREVPFFTEPHFSYALDVPKQHVSHHLGKLKAKYFFKEGQILELVLAAQLNDRKEFDFRRVGRIDIPALSLLQYTFNGELKYAKYFGEGWRFRAGNQNILTDNTNNPETGILPLIPDYLSWKSGLFSVISKSFDKTQVHLGARYDFEYQNVVTISTTLPRKIIRYENQFHNLSGLFSIKYDLTNKQNITLNTGYAMRSPAINERYSNGLHQGVSGIEEGDVSLSTEKAIKNSLEYLWTPNTRYAINALVYYQHFKNYINLIPQDEIRLTIRGAFPVFKYEQTDANIYGLDLSAQLEFNKAIHGQFKYSYIRGNDSKNNNPLVFMPPNRFFGSLAYNTAKQVKISDKLKLDIVEFEINDRLVLKQKHIRLDQDFVSPPPAYNLIGMKISTNLLLPKYKFRLFAKADNLLNVRYRDYLNRQRYFADDTGISIV